jgi:kumamolisin
MGATSSLVPLHGSEREPLPGSVRIGAVPDHETVRFSVALRPRKDAPAIDAHATAARGQFLSVDDLVAANAPDQADVDAVTSYARRHGLTVEGADPLTRRVKLAGPASAVRAAFGVALERYEHRGRTFRGRTGPVLIPSDLEDVIVGVIGTDDRPVVQRHATVQVEPQFTSGSQFLSPLQVANFYSFPPGLDGSGQCIGIIEFGGGYDPADLSAYASSLGLSNPSTVDVLVDGATNDLTQPPPGQPDPTVEVELDVELAAAIAPAAQIAVYFAPNTSQGWLDVFSTAIQDAANSPSVLSVSWSGAEPNWTQQLVTQADNLLASAAVAGITVLVSSGDAGSNGSGTNDGLAHAEFPPSSPNVTGVGGTVLQLDADGNVAQEVTWNNGIANRAVSGGGVSQFFPVPLFQSQIGLNPTSANPPNDPGRGVPDVAGHADSYAAHIRGQDTGVSGTSASTPLWAGLIARINQGIGGRVGFLNPMLYGPVLRAGSFHDITIGDNGAYAAAPGWDACTGLGTPAATTILLTYRTVRNTPPVVTGLSASSGSAGDNLTVSGSGFLGATAVGFGAVAAAPTVLDDTQITVTVPNGPASGTTVDVTVTAPGGASATNAADQFTYN